MRNGWSTLLSTCCTKRTMASMTIAWTNPLATSASRTAMMPVATAPTIGMKDARKISTVSGMTSGTPRMSAPMPMPRASTAATITWMRAYWPSATHPRVAAPSAGSRAGTGSRRVIQRAMVDPSRRKKKVANSEISMPAKKLPTLVAAPTTPVAILPFCSLRKVLTCCVPSATACAITLESRPSGFD